jgi:spore germination protein GerM
MATTQIDETPVNQSDHSRRTAVVALVVGLLVFGWFARSVAVDGSQSLALRWLPWMQRTSINLYFGHPSDSVLVPISRSMAPSDETPVAIIDALLAGPPDGLGLLPLIPAGTTLRTATLDDGVFSVDLSGDVNALDDPMTIESLGLSISSWSAVRAVEVALNGVPVDMDSAMSHQMYFWDRTDGMLVAMPATALSPRDVLAEYLAGPDREGFFGLPSEVQVVSYRLDGRNGLLTLDFTFEDSLRAFALEDSQGMRRVLEGLIATMTITFPEVDGVYLDFGGQPMLGLGHCADLLRSLQLTPKPLNDERLLSRSSA